jgi:hypothetical protein
MVQVYCKKPSLQEVRNNELENICTALIYVNENVHRGPLTWKSKSN